MIPKLRPDLCTKLFQRVIVSCQYLYHLEGIELISGQSVYNRFTEFGFYTPDSNPILAMRRRFADMVSCGLLEYVKIQDGVKLYKLTVLGRRVKAHHCHIGSCLVINANKKDIDMPKRGHKKNDVIRKPIEESIIKKECKEYLPPIKPTTIIGKIKYLYMMYKSL